MILSKVPCKDDRCIDIGTFSTTTDLYSALDTFGASLNDSDSKDIHFVCTASPFYDSTAPASDIFAVFYRSSTGRYFCECFNSLSSNIQPILLWRWSGGWAITNLVNNAALNAKFPSKTAEFNVSGSNEETVSLSSGAIYKVYAASGYSSYAGYISEYIVYNHNGTPTYAFEGGTDVLTLTPVDTQHKIKVKTSATFGSKVTFYRVQ